MSLSSIGWLIPRLSFPARTIESSARISDLALNFWQFAGAEKYSAAGTPCIGPKVNFHSSSRSAHRRLPPSLCKTCSHSCAGLFELLGVPAFEMEVPSHGTAVYGSRLDTIVESEEKAWDADFTLPPHRVQVPHSRPIVKRLTCERAVNPTWFLESKNTPRQIYSTQPLHFTSFDYNDAAVTHRQVILHEELAQHRHWGTSDPDEFEDHWSRLCDMEWDIVQELPENIKRRLGNEWEFDELEPVRYIILKSKELMLIT